MKLLLTSKAISDIEVIYTNIAIYIDTTSAERIVSDIYKIMELALTQPEMGTLGRVNGTRELFPRNGKYRIVYRVKEQQLEILRVILSKRKYPSK